MKLNTLQALVLGILVVFTGSQAVQAQSAPSENSEANSTPQSGSMASDKPHDEKFVIGNDDVLAISVWNEPNLTKSVPVRSDGKISLPLAGEMQAAGKTPMQLERDISDKLKNFITAPEVTVIVQQVLSRKFNILGQVGKPGAYPLTAATTIVDAIATAGGLRDFAKKTGIYVLRKSSGGQQERLKFNYKDFLKGKNTSQNIKVEPNDTIIVP
ncbi:MAG TPA: polysaccharide biosynthesis/export family protein [Terracidiphilus sp.]|nr:polysaccharide biosynthesis/export family protein [Terracidiphilus sp.]